MTASANGTPATPPNSSTPPSASPCPRYAARSLHSARAFRRRDGGRVSEACIRRFGFDWLVRGFLSVVMMSYMVRIHTIVVLRTHGCAAGVGIPLNSGRVFRCVVYRVSGALGCLVGLQATFCLARAVP